MESPFKKDILSTYYVPGIVRELEVQRWKTFIRGLKLQSRDLHRPPAMMELCCMDNKIMDVQSCPNTHPVPRAHNPWNGTHNRHRGEATHAPPLGRLRRTLSPTEAGLWPKNCFGGIHWEMLSVPLYVWNFSLRKMVREKNALLNQCFSEFNMHKNHLGSW